MKSRMTRTIRTSVVLAALCVGTLLGTSGEAHHDVIPALATVTVDSSSPVGSTTTVSLLAGRVYRIVASGTYQYHVESPPAYLADAECSKEPGRQTDLLSPVSSTLWGRERLTTDQTNGRYSELADSAQDLLVDGLAVEWVPMPAKGLGCNELDSVNPSVTVPTSPPTTVGVHAHVYETYVLPEVTKPYTFKIWEPLAYAGAPGVVTNPEFYADNSGTLTVRVYELAPRSLPVTANAYLGAVPVDSSLASGSAAKFGMVGGQPYLMLATGSYGYAQANPTKVPFNPVFALTYRADAECTTWGQADLTYRTSRPATQIPQNSYGGPDPQTLYIDGADALWVPLTQNGARPDACDPTNSYTTTYTPSVSGQARLRVRETSLGGYEDNLGFIFVHIFAVRANQV